MKTFPIKNSFTRGIFSQAVWDRTDEPVFQNGCAALQNYFPLPTGGITRRGGFHVVAGGRKSTGKTELKGFSFSDSAAQNYCLEFSDRALRFFWNYDKKPIIDPASLAPGLKFSYGGTGAGWDAVTFSGTYTGSERVRVKVVCSAVSPNVFDYYENETLIETYTTTGSHNLGNGILLNLDVTKSNHVADFWFSEVCWPLTLKTPYESDDLHDLQAIQEDDVILLCHPDYVPQKLSRFAHDEWEMEPADFDGAPWRNTTGLRYKIWDCDGVYGVVKSAATSASKIAYYFSEAGGAAEKDSGVFAQAIALSRVGTYYESYDFTSYSSITYVGFEVTGTIRIPEDGDYRFALNAGDEGADFAIDGDIVCDRYQQNKAADNPSGAKFQAALQAKSGSKALTKGMHRIRLRAVLDKGAAQCCAALYWKKPEDSLYAVVPAEYFSKNEETSRYGVETATYRYYDLTGATIPATVLQNTGCASGSFTFTQAGLGAHTDSAVLTAGMYRFRLRYYSQGFGFAAALAWKEPLDTEFAAVPRIAMTPAPGYYPGCLTFHEQRLLMAGMYKLPQTVYCSEAYDKENFITGTDASDPFEFTVASDRMDRILFLMGKDRGLVAGSAATEYLIRGRDGLFGPGEIYITPNTYIGSRAVQPVRGADQFFFVDRSGMGVLEYRYQWEQDQESGLQIDFLCTDLFKDGIRKVCWQSGYLAAFRFGFDGSHDYPHRLNLLWVLTANGYLKALTRETTEKVYAWSEQVISFGTVDSICSVTDEGGDRLWISLMRSGERWVGYLDAECLADYGDVFFGGVIDLPHLAGDTVSVVGITSANVWTELADVVLPASGQATIAGDYAYILAGLAPVALCTTLAFDTQIAKNQSTLSAKKRWVKPMISYVASLGITVQSAEDSGNTETILASGQPEFGETAVTIPGWTRRARLTVMQDNLMPGTILSMFGQLQVNL